MAESGIVSWRSKEVTDKVAGISNRELWPAAEIIHKHIKRKFQQRTYGTGSGELFRSIKEQKSKYKNGGYIIGVFGRRTAQWEDSVGARAIFFEFGRAAPGYGSRDTAAGRRARQANKVQPPRPFIRTGLQSAKHEIRRKLKLKVR